TGSSFEANWNFGFARTVLVGTVTRRLFFQTLTVQEFTTFTDHSGRTNYTVTETFMRARPIKPTRIGIPATNYPLGDPAKPVFALFGTWVNTSPTTPGIRKIVLGLNPNGTLSVRVFGACVPVLCAWGRITGITFGTSVSSVTGRTFLAPYQFGFA